MSMIQFPVIDPVATGANICRLRKDRGQSLPSVDNLYALSALLQVPMNEIIISTSHIVSWEQQAAACCSGLFMGNFLQVQWAWQNFKTA